MGIAYRVVRTRTRFLTWVNNRRGGASAIAAAAVLWALIGVYSRELNARDIGPAEIAFWRAFGGGTCFVVHHLVARRRAAVPSTRLGPSEWGRVVAFAMLCVSVFFIALPKAVGAGGITIAYVLLYTAPVWVTIGARLWLGEHADRRRWALVIVTVTGVVLVVLGGGDGGSVSPRAAAWGLAAGASYSGHYLLGRRLFETIGVVRTFALALPLGAVPLLWFAPVSTPTLSEAALLGGLVVGSTWLPYLLLGIGLRRVESSRAVVIATLEPVVAAVLGATLYHEQLGVGAWLGGGMVVVAAAFAGQIRE